MDALRHQQAELARAEEQFSEYSRLRRQVHSEATDELNQGLKSELEKLEKSKTQKIDDMRKAYQVEISSEGKAQQEQLALQRKEFEAQRANLINDAETTFKKVEAREKTKLEAYRKSQDEVLAKIQKQYHEAIDEFKRRGES